ncbi:MAG: hypothetical protein PHY29_11240 [Syntrophales bacterium]|nr:hypothetical protein [Syntrophales bacterium]
MTELKPKVVVAVALAMILILAGSPAALAMTDQPGNPVLSIAPDGVDFGVMRDTATGVRLVEIGGIGKVTWMVKWAEPWLTLDTYSGVVEDGGTQIISITASPRGLSLGRHTTEIVITTSSGTRTVPVSITVLRGSDVVPRPELKEILLTPPAFAAQVGRKVRLSAAGVYSDGSQKDITKEIEWVSDNRTVGYFADKGLLIGKSVGNVRVFAKEGRVQSPVMTIHMGALKGPLLKVRLPKTSQDHVEKGSTEMFSLSLQNAGTGELEWEVISRVSWLVVGGNAPEWKNGHNGSSLRGTGGKSIKVTVDATGLPEGEYEGTIIVRSNGGDDEITIPVTILSLTSISLTPASIRMAANDRMMLRATGIWSDGSRTDLSNASACRWIISDPSIGFFLSRRPVFVAGRAGRVEIRRVRGAVNSNVAVVDVEEAPTDPVLLVSPHEVDFGTIGPGEASKGIISLKNVGGGALIWQAYGVGDWVSTESGTPSGTAGRSGRLLRVSVESVAKDDVSVSGLFAVRIRLEMGHNSVSYEKLLPAGSYREKLRLHFNGGDRSVFLKFTIAETASRSSMNIQPLGIDFGSVAAEGTLMKKIELRNVGKNVLKWVAVLQGSRKTFREVILEKGRYVSFANEAVSGKDHYRVPKRLEDRIEIFGEWTGNRGYPYGTGEDSLLRYSFSGSGITVFLWKDIGGGTVQVFVDGRLTGAVDCASEERKRIEFPAAENLAEGGTHRLVLAVKGGAVEIEGARVYTASLMEGRKGWMVISPERGTTTNEVDYITVSVTPEGLAAGSYSENIIFYSDEGVEVVEVSLDVAGDKLSELVDIFRYIKGSDMRLSPEGAQGDLRLQGYRKEGPLFRLFRKGTSGTSELFQWYNPSKGIHFYSYNRSGWKRSLEGYVFDGPIGNIATLKLIGTRDLYTWFNPETGAYFYTTDPKGEGYEKRGYVYDGVVGYVR